MNTNIGEYLMGFSKFHLVQVPVKHTLKSITSGLGVLKRITGTWGACVAGAPTRRALLRGENFRCRTLTFIHIYDFNLFVG